MRDKKISDHCHHQYFGGEIIALDQNRKLVQTKRLQCPHQIAENMPLFGKKTHFGKGNDSCIPYAKEQDQSRDRKNRKKLIRSDLRSEIKWFHISSLTIFCTGISA